MKKNLTLKETIFITSMLFGMFFGAGNLIFPVLMGQMAGSKLWPAIIGFIITGVSLPLLAVAALGKSRSNGLFELGLKVSRGYSLFFTCALYLTIGPFFAIPRCASVSFTVGITPILGHESKLVLLIFSFCFFAAALWFSLRPGKIMTWVGKFLNPFFLVFLAVLVVRALISPMGSCMASAPDGDYQTASFVTGFFEGYNTMDALAGLAFGIVVVTVIKNLDIENSDDVARNTIRAGVFSCLLMGLIYLAMTVVGAQSRSVLGICGNGGEALSKIAEYYFGKPGAILLAITVTLACLKTSVGLITSCSEAFSKMFPNSISQRKWAVIFAIVSFGIANLGLNQIIQLSLPVLMFLYPLAIVLILLALCEKTFGGSRLVYKVTIYITLIPATVELVKSLPWQNSFTNAIIAAGNLIPLESLGFGWICPAALGFIVSLIISKKKAN